MSVKPGDKMSVTLLPLSMTMKQQQDMVLFTITDHALVYAEDAGEGIRMKIKLKRKITSEMMTTYFPSLLLMMITFATTFFRPFFFEAALSVNLTTMLVMTTIFISKMEGLPSTSDIKMIDIWLVFCQMVTFTEVVLVTAMEYKRDERKKRKAKRGRKKIGKRIKNSSQSAQMREPKIDHDTKAPIENYKYKMLKWKLPSLKTFGRFS